MKIFSGFASLVLAAGTISTIYSEARCPGDVAVVHFQVVNRHHTLIDVSINHSGPYTFLLDTGAQSTLIDRPLAAELNLKFGKTAAIVANAGTTSFASFANVELLQTGSHSVANLAVLVYDLQNLTLEKHLIRGILGEDFLERFDVLIDNAHNLLCLDDSATMRANIRGQHIALLPSGRSSNSWPEPAELIVTVRLSSSKRPLRLKLDSGANVSILFNVAEFMRPGQSLAPRLDVNGVDGAHEFSSLPLQEVGIGSLDLTDVSFVARRRNANTTDMAKLDGLLPTGLFRRVFIDHADHFAVLETW